jgi:uncharacterized protein
MTNVKALRELQEIEQERTALRASFMELKGKRDESPALRDARAAAQSAARRLQLAQKTQKEREHEFDMVSRKLAASQSTLYGGKVKNPKELQGIEEEVKYLTGRADQLQEEILGVLIEVEEAGSALAAAEASLRETEGDWGGDQQAIEQEMRRQSKRLAALDAQRTALHSQLPKADIELYLDMRRRKGPAPIALVTGGNCGGCGVKLSVIQKYQVQNGEELVFCSSCGRLLTMG